jgi:RNA polymerase sigma-70 factor (ECF subfamily)
MDCDLRGSTSEPLTTLKVRSALAGDDEARAWIVLRFSPLLLAQARYRMRNRLRRYYDPEDVVADAWQRALPRLGDFGRDERRSTPRLVAFLATIVTYRVNELIRQWAHSPLGGLRGDDGASSEVTSLPARQPDPYADVLRNLVSKDEVGRAMAMIEELDPRDREILVLRKVEGLSSSAVAKRLGVSTNVVDTRLSRALARLRARWQDSVLDELVDDDR